MPWWAFAWRYREDFRDSPHNTHWWHWWHHCVGSATWWLDKLLERLPGGALFAPTPRYVCYCDECVAAAAHTDDAQASSPAPALSAGSPKEPK